MSKNTNTLYTSNVRGNRYVPLLHLLDDGLEFVDTDRAAPICIVLHEKLTADIRPDALSHPRKRALHLLAGDGRSTVALRSWSHFPFATDWNAEYGSMGCDIIGGWTTDDVMFVGSDATTSLSPSGTMHH